MFTTGKPALSAFDTDHFLDYDKYESNLKIIRNRYNKMDSTHHPNPTLTYPQVEESINFN